MPAFIPQIINTELKKVTLYTHVGLDSTFAHSQPPLRQPTATHPGPTVPTTAHQRLLPGFGAPFPTVYLSRSISALIPSQTLSRTYIQFL